MAEHYRQYAKDRLSIALEMVRSGALSTRAAAKTYGVPKSTISDKIRGKVQDDARSGPATVLTKAEETSLVEYLQLMSSIGYPLNRSLFCRETKRILDIDGRPNPFKNNMPGITFITSLLLLFSLFVVDSSNIWAIVSTIPWRFFTVSWLLHAVLVQLLYQLKLYTVH